LCRFLNRGDALAVVVHVFDVIIFERGRHVNEGHSCQSRWSEGGRDITRVHAKQGVEGMHSYGEGEDVGDLLMWSRLVGPFLPRLSEHEAIRTATGRRSSIVGRTGVRTMGVVNRAAD
jgi:hypothetical protein